MKPKQIWLRNTKKFQFVRCVLFEKTSANNQEEFSDVFYINGVGIMGFKQL